MARKIFALTLVLALMATVPALGQNVPQHYTAKTKVASGYFATVNRLCVYDDFSEPRAVEKFERVWQKTKEILERIEQLASVSVPGSEIAQFNRLSCGQSMPISPETAHLIALSRAMCQTTEGYYDPTVYPLVDLWGFSPRFTYSSDPVMPYDRQRQDGALPGPDPRYIQALRQLVGMDGIAVVEDGQGGYRMRKDTPPVTVDGVTYQAQIDLGGIAKGYACDLVAALLKAEGYQYGFFSSGSSSISLLKNASAAARKADDPTFQLEVRKPRETGTPTGAYAMVRLNDQALSSSGDYGSTYMLDGDVCCHIINPFTGYPMNVPSQGVQQGVCTVTLLSGNATQDDAYTTALCLMSPLDAIDYLNEHLPGRDVLVVLYRADRQVYEVVTNLDADRLTLTDDAYVLASRVDEKGRIVYTGTLFDARP